MTTAELLADLRRSDIRLWFEGDQLRFDAPPGAMTEDLRARILQHRADLAEVLASEGDDRSPLLPLAPRGTHLPLSFEQERLWFLHQLQPGLTAYNEPVTVRLTGSLDPDALERGLNALVERHEILHTTFPTLDGRPGLAVSGDTTLALRVEDLRRLPQDVRFNEALRLIREDSALPFELATGPLIRAALFRLGEADHVFHLTIHHIIADGWSMGVFFRELGALYAAFSAGRPSPLPELPIQYADYAAWQRRRLKGGHLQGELAFWRRRLTGLGPLDLPTDRPRPVHPSHQGCQQPFQFREGLTRAVRDLARRESATPFMALMAAFQVLLARYSGQDDIAVGTPIAGRNRLELEGLVGFFVNVLVLRTDLSGDVSFRELLGRVRRASLDALCHQELPFEAIVKDLQPEREPARNPLIQVVFNHFHLGRMFEGTLGNLKLEAVPRERQSSKFDLSLHCFEWDGAFAPAIEYSTDLFDAGTVRRMSTHYRNLLEAAVADPDQPISRLQMLDDAEREQIFRTGNRKTGPPLAEDTVLHMFDELVSRAPDAPALAFEGVRLSRAELDLRAAVLARQLRARGVRSEDRVGVCVEPCAEMIIGLLAVLKAGAAYVPIEPTYPRDRQQYILDDSEAVALLTQSHLVHRLPERVPQVLCLDRELEPTSGPLPAPDPSSLAYIAYTSGSTGTPKGVEVEHRQLHAYVRDVLPRLALPRGASLATVSTVASDLGNTAIYGALCGGGVLHVIARERTRDGDAFAEYVRREAIDCLKIMPSHLEALLAAAVHPADLLPRRQVVLGGERCTWQLIDRITELSPACKVINHYGPTETTVGVLTHWVRPGDRERHPVAPPLGKPLEGTRAYVLDALDRPVPIGVPGELCIAGPNVARGYRNQPQLNARQYVQDPFDSPGERMYRTGDRVRFRADGTIEFLGRKDEQVKIRGHRVEPGEVKERLQRLACVETCAVVARDVDGPAGGLRLVAYIVRAGQERVDPDMLRDELRRHVPEYMLPAAYVFVDRLPLMANGKLDQKALPAPEAPGGRVAPVPPRDSEEETLARIWSQVLGTELVGVHDNYFELGGDSILGIQIVARARQAGLPLGPQDVMLHPSVAEMARAARERVQAASPSLDLGTRGALSRPKAPSFSPFSLMQLQPEERTRIEERYGAAGIEDAYPLSPLQSGLVYHALAEPDSRVYVLQAAITLRGKLDAAAYREAWRRTIDRYEALRTAFVTADVETMHQVVCRTVEFPWREEDWSGLCAEERQTRIDKLEREEVDLGFDLARAPLLRLRLVRTSTDRHRFVLTVHHLLLDGWSMGVVTANVSREYAAITEGRSTSVEDPPRYADHIGLLQARDQTRARKYWKDALRDWDRTPLPAQRRPASSVPRPPESVAVDLPASRTEALRSFARQHHLTLNTVVLGAWALILCRYVGRKDVVFGVTVSGRPPELPRVESAVGLFINTLPLRVKSEDRELMPWLRELQELQLSLQEYSYTALFDVQRFVGAPGQAGLFDSIFVFENYPSPPGGTAAHGLVVENARQHIRTHYPLTVVVRPGRELRLELLYDPGSIDHGLVAQMVRHLATLLESFREHPDARLGELTMLSAEERRRSLREWNDTRVDYPRDRLVHELVAAHAQLTPGALAVSGPDGHASYAELNDRADRIARFLVSRGVGPGSRVAIGIGRGVHLAAAALGVLKAGGAYVPLDPEDPPRRLQGHIENVGSRMVLAVEATASRFAPGTSEVVRVDVDGLEVEGPASGTVTVGPEHAAYVIFTSGSAGRPKGVEISHGSLLNLVHWHRRAYGVTPQDRGSLVAAVGFDASVWELWPYLAGGASVHAPAEEDRGEPARLWSWLARERVTIAFLPTPYAEAALRERLPAALGLRYLLTGGDRLVRPPAVALPFEVVNHYGPTECTVVATAAPVAPQAGPSPPPPIGRPIANTLALVLDERLEPVPVGVPGELFVGGEGLARGYSGSPEDTAERFIENPFEELAGASARLYRTGDRVRRLEDGSLDYLGRIDEQVKIRGFRVEPAEVEAALLQDPRVQAAAVVAREEDGGSMRLVAYVVAESGRNLSQAALRDAIGKSLPRHMIPSAFVMLEALPLTPSGKVDRRALPSVVPSHRDETVRFVPPSTPQERILAKAWQQVLNLEQVGVDDNFYDLGGDSILSIRLVALARDTGLGLELDQVFRHPTIRQLATVVEEGPGVRLEAQQSEVVGDIPLTPIQRWFFDQEHPEAHHFNQAMLFKVRTSRPTSVWEKAIAAILRHHDALRLRYAISGGGWRQVSVASSDDVPFTRVDLSAQSPAERQQSIAEAAAALQPSLHLHDGPLLRATLFECGAGEHDRLLLVVHHLAMDGLSWRILRDDLQRLCEPSASDRVSLPAKTTSFQAWSQRLQRHADSSEVEQELEYWLALPWDDVPSLPQHQGSGRGTSATSRSVRMSLDEAETRTLLQEVPRAYNTRIDDVLLTALALSVAPWTGSDTLLVDVEGHGRESTFAQFDLSRTVGWFTSLTPVLLRVDDASAGGADPGKALKSVKEQLRAIPSRGIGYGLLRYLSEDPSIGERLSRLPRPQILFNYLGQLEEIYDNGEFLCAMDAPIGPLHGPRNQRSHLLAVTARIVGRGLQVTFSYSAEVHDRSTIERVNQRFGAELRGLLAHCVSPTAGEFTPSDFAEFGWDQGTLDRLASEATEAEAP